MARLVQAVPDTWLSVSATTRKPREGEQEGVNYYFLSKRAFKAKIERGEFLEWAEYAGNFYGTPLASVNEHRALGEQVLLEIEVQGAAQVREKVPDAVLVFIAPPSLEELERRLRNRGTDSEEAIARRLEAAKRELPLQDDYDVVIINDDLDVAANELIDIVNEYANTDTRTKTL